MCLTCGCGEPHREMGESNITYDDVKQVADENGMTVAETVAKLQTAVEIERQEAVSVR